MAALVTFESAARHENFSRAAKEMAISQPAVSRQIAGLEKQLAVRLFDRSPEGVTLTAAGAQFRDAVKAGLSVIQAAAVKASLFPHGEQVVIACSEDSSNFFLLPRHHALQAALGDQTEVRIITFPQHVGQLPAHSPADVVLTWEASIDSEDYVVIHEECAGPVCSPEFASRHRDLLKLPVGDWHALPFLELARPNLGWVSWEDWFRMAGAPEISPRFKQFDSYSYVLNAAIHGLGIAMGWRHYIEEHLESGALVPLAGGFATFGNRFCGMLTAQGRRKPAAQKCVSLLVDGS